MSQAPPAVILLATRNGERFLPAQLESILAQSHENWRLLARDDDSTDRTPEVLKDFAARDRRIQILPGGQQQGATGNFSLLLSAAPGTGLCFFCDQDDLWPHDRLERMLAAFESRTSQTAPETPALLHTDLRLIDSAGAEIAPSMRPWVAASHADDDPLGLLLAQNFVTGCSATLNEPLRHLAAPIPTEAINHDWWLALIAAATGHIHYLAEALTDHRRHAANSNPISRSPRWRDRLPSKAPANPARRRLVRRLKQSVALERRLAERAPECPALPRLRAWNRAWKKGPLAAVRASIRHGIRLQDPARTALFRSHLLACLPLTDAD